MIIYLIIITIIVFIIFALLLTMFVSHQKSRGKLDPKVPGPKPNPIFGNFLQLRKANETEQVTQWFEIALKYGQVFGISAPFKEPALFTVDPRDTEHILKTNFDNYIKGEELQHVFTPLAGQGIFNVNGDAWRSQRKMASHIFKVKSLRSMVETFKEHGRVLFQKIDEIDGKQLDGQDLMFRFTFDAICSIAFGLEMNTLRKGKSAFSSAFDVAQNMIEQNARSPFYRYLPTKSHHKKALALLEQEAQEIIKVRRRENNNSSESNQEDEDLLSLYLSISSGADNKYLRDVVLNYLLAGRDTTGATLTFALYYLAKYPQQCERLYQEINENCFKGLSDDADVDALIEALDYDKLKSLPYTKAVIDECLRLTPPVPYDPKTAVHDDVLPSGYKVRAGTTVVWSAYIQGRWPDWWDQPEKFNPDRWLAQSPLKHGPYQHTPFQAGLRRCLGETMAYLEVKSVLAMLVKRYRFKLADPSFKLEVVKNITLFAGGKGVPLIFEKRGSS